jgi:hypothetical protein
VVGSRALGMCVKRHRGRRPVKVLADALERSERWLSYLEAGETSAAWEDLIAIANTLGPTAGRAFLDDAVPLLYEEAEIERVRRDVMQAVQRREFLGVLGAGAAIDFERLGGVLRGLGVDAQTVSEMKTFTQVCADQSRLLAPGIVISNLQGHLRNFMDLVATVAGEIETPLKAGAAEAALLAGTLTFRMGFRAEANHYWLLARGLASEGRHHIAHAYVLAVQAALVYSPVPSGGYGGDPKQAQSLLDQALAIAGPKPPAEAVVVIHKWRAEQFAAMGDEVRTQRDLDATAKAYAQLGRVEDFTGLGSRTPELEQISNRANCAMLLQKPKDVIGLLETDEVMNYGSPGWRSARKSEIAAAYAQLHENELAATTLLEATDLAVASRDPWRLHWVKGTRNRWLPQDETGAYKELDHRLASATCSAGSNQA